MAVLILLYFSFSHADPGEITLDWTFRPNKEKSIYVVGTIGGTTLELISFTHEEFKAKLPEDSEKALQFLKKFGFEISF